MHFTEWLTLIQQCEGYSYEQALPFKEPFNKVMFKRVGISSTDLDFLFKIFNVYIFYVFYIS